MKQSEMRAASRGAPAGRVPASFGRQAAESEPEPEDFSIRGGESFHLVLHVDVTPDAEKLAALRQAVREATRAGVLDGYADAIAEMDDPVPGAGVEGAPGGVHGGAPPGAPLEEVDGCG